MIKTTTAHPSAPVTVRPEPEYWYDDLTGLWRWSDHMLGHPALTQDECDDYGLDSRGCAYSPGA